METKVTKPNLMPLVMLAALSCICNDEECYNATLVEAPEEPEQVNLEFFVQKIADKKGWKFEKANGWLGSIAETCPMAAFNIVAREIAVYLDHKYDDHIEKSDKIYIISSLDGRIHEVCKKHIKNYRNFAAFRTIEDAKLACNILREQLKCMFASNAKRK